MFPLLKNTLLSGSAVSLTTNAVLSFLARREGRHPVQAVNATSHWYLGPAAGHSRAVDLKHTLGGYVTHHAASMLWAAVFEAVRRWRPHGGPIRQAAAVAGLAALVDYGVVPKRLTPGWEKVVTPRSISIAYAVMALTLAASCAVRKRG